jgi:hypothetical protein
MCSPEQRGCVALGVAADELDATGKPELGRERFRRRPQLAGDD